jgi:hypothetical protein
MHMLQLERVCRIGVYSNPRSAPEYLGLCIAIRFRFRFQFRRDETRRGESGSLIGIREHSTESEPYSHILILGDKGHSAHPDVEVNVCQSRRTEPIDPPWTLPFPSPLSLSATLAIMATLSAPTDPAIKSTRQRGHSAMVRPPDSSPWCSP